jgi:hypothetical protein
LGLPTHLAGSAGSVAPALMNTGPGAQKAAGFVRIHQPVVRVQATGMFDDIHVAAAFFTSSPQLRRCSLTQPSPR